MRCKICQNEFIPNKYHPLQQVCARPECRRIRQIQSLREWRIKNPTYFKYLEQETPWRQARHRYNQLWRARHKEDLKEYAQSHKEQRREYMRGYMRRRRKAKNVNRDKS